MIINLMKRKKNRTVSFLCLMLGIATLISPALFGEESIIPLVQEAGFSYYKPEVKIAPNADIYVAYQRKNNASSHGDIYLTKYSREGIVSFVKNVSESTKPSYEPELEITPTGDIHVAWVEKSGNTHIVRYRSFDGTTWSQIYTMGQVDNSKNIEDLRLAVDTDGNAFIVFMYWPIAQCKFISKYGNTITIENFPMAGRQKHPDVAVDDNYVHIVWQYKPGAEYTIGYQRRPNSPHSAWDPWIDLRFYETQRPRMALDTNNDPHVVFFHDLGATRKLWYKKWNGTKFADNHLISNPEKFESYHFCDIDVEDPGNILASVQSGRTTAGQGIYYSWKKQGVWTPYSMVGNSEGAGAQSMDLAADGEGAVIAFGLGTYSLNLAIMGQINPSMGLETIFTHPTVFAGSEVIFDASGTAGLNPNQPIVSYEWDFGDGTIETTTASTISHTYSTYGLSLPVKLTVQSNTGAKGYAKEDVQIHALFGAVVTSVVSKRIRSLFFNRAANELSWIANPKNVDAAYPAITKYEIWRAVSSTVPSGDQYTLIAEVDADVLTYLDYNGVMDNTTYNYNVVSVDSEGHKSPFGNN